MLFFNPRVIFTLVIVGGILIFIIAAFSHAANVLIRGESSYDPRARKEAVISAIVALILALGLLVWLFRRAIF